MPTNTTTPEAATTTTPATNTNTTPLSAMTGEEVASILVGLIRQNDGVLIQQKVTDGINQSPAGAELSQGKAAIVAALQSVGITASTNDSLDQLAQKIGTTDFNIIGCNVIGGKTAKLSECLLDQRVTSISSDLVEQLRGYSLAGGLSSVTKLSLPNCTTLLPYSTSGSSLVYLNLPKANNLPGNSLIEGCGSLVYLNLASYTNYVPNYDYTFGSLASLRHMICRGIFPNSMGRAAAAKLYDMRVSVEVTSNKDFRYWNPTTALSTSLEIAQITDKDEWDDANEPTFSNNLQKFLWYFEYHFIPCFGTVTTSPVLSLYTTVYNAINSANSISDPTKTLKQLLTDKGWEVASVS